MKYLEMNIFGQQTSDLVEQFVFLQEYIREGAISGSGYMDKRDMGPSRFLIKEQEFDTPFWNAVFPMKLHLKVSIQGKETERLVEQLEEILEYVRDGAKAGFGNLAHNQGAFRWIIREQPLNSAEKGEKALCND